MPLEPLMSDERKSVIESGEDAFRRVAARKLRERGCGEAEIDSSVRRLLAKPVGLKLDDTQS